MSPHRLAVLRGKFNISRVRYDVAIEPEAGRQIYWTMVSSDAFVSIDAPSAFSLESAIDESPNLALVFGLADWAEIASHSVFLA